MITTDLYYQWFASEWMKVCKSLNRYDLSGIKIACEDKTYQLTYDLKGSYILKK